MNHGKNLSLSPNDAPLEKPGSNFQAQNLKHLSKSTCTNTYQSVPSSALAQYVGHNLAKIFFTSKFQLVMILQKNIFHIQVLVSHDLAKKKFTSKFQLVTILQKKNSHPSFSQSRYCKNIFHIQVLVSHDLAKIFFTSKFQLFTFLQTQHT